MKVLVTGSAGFIGSHLCERLLQLNDTEVIGIDGFINPSPNETKQRNLKLLLVHPRFRFNNLARILDGVQVVYH